MDRRRAAHLVWACLAGLVSCSSEPTALGRTAASGAAAVRDAPRHPAVVLATYPHDAGAFTQGLVIADGELYESTGRAGRSEVRRTTLATGAVEASTALAPSEFGEGLAAVGDRLVQLTWTSGIGHVYDRATLRPESTFAYPGEGWGLTFDGEHLVMSDGTPELRLLDPTTFAEIGRVAVTDGGSPVDELNELEYVDGLIYANVWHSPDIAVIDPATGIVREWIDTSSLRPTSTAADGDAVVNGIAYDAAGGALYVTGKRWAVLYEIEPPG